MTLTIFKWPVRVYYEDTDAGGVVYHSNYVTFMERARTEWLRHLGYEQDELKDKDNVLFVVRSVNVKFNQPARFNDLLDVSVELKNKGKASLVLTQKIQRHGEDAVLCEGEVKIASISADKFRPVPTPQTILEKLS